MYVCKRKNNPEKKMTVKREKELQAKLASRRRMVFVPPKKSVM
jgi:hypothetical protein